MQHSIDPELNYCPRCHDEYRPDIQRCAACGVALQNGALVLAQMEAQKHKTTRSLKIEADEPLLAVRKGTVAQIKELQTRLMQRGLPSLAIKEGAGGCGCRGTELVLQVRESDLPEVMAVLEEEYRQSTGLDDHDTRFAGAVYDTQAAEAVCPTCGHRFSTTATVCPGCGLCFV